MITHQSRQFMLFVCASALILTAGCTSLKTPATADVAVSKAAVENAAGAGGPQFAPMEMAAAR